MKRISCSPRPNAFTFVGLLIIIALLAILAAMLLPALAKAKQRAQRINCVNNLKQCAISFMIWAGDNGDRFPMSVPATQGGTMEWVDGGNAFRHFQVMSNELNTPKILICPSDTRSVVYRFRELENQNLSYFVGLDATNTLPQGLLTGDRNVTNGLAPQRTVLALRADRPAGWTPAIHVGQGNIGLTDGSVQQVTKTGLQSLLQSTGNRNNRIALPE